VPPVVDQALDAVVFGPIGALSTALADPEAMARKGRLLVSRELRSARAVGRFAVDRVARQVGSMAGQLPSLLADQLDAWLRSAGAGRASSAPRPGGRASASGAERSDGSQPAPGRRPRRTPGPGAGLAIPGYDSLSATQVLPRLASLSPAELEEVRRYEAATRGRRTILNRIAQLQAGSG